MRVKRYDLGKVDKAEITPQGFLRAPVFATRTGVFKYQLPNGETIKELRLPDEVFDSSSLATLAGAPLTNNHPESFVDTNNAKQLMVGFCSDKVERQDRFVKTIVTITDQDMIRQVELGKHEVSCGYECELEEKAGTYDGEDYDFIQRKIKYNHLAIVDRGRAGPEVKLRLDSHDAYMVGGQENLSKKQEEKNMEKIMVNGKEFEVAPEVAAHLKSMMAEMEDAKSKLASLDKKDIVEEKSEEPKEKDTMEAEKDALQAKVDALTEEVKKLSNDKPDIAKAVKERLALVKVAEKTLKADQIEKLDTMLDLEIKKLIIKAKSENANLDGKSEAYIQARFDHISETLGETSSSDMGNELLNKRKADADKVDSDKAREKAMTETQNAWTKPIGLQKSV